MRTLAEGDTRGSDTDLPARTDIDTDLLKLREVGVVHGRFLRSFLGKVRGAVELDEVEQIFQEFFQLITVPTTDARLLIVTVLQVQGPFRVLSQFQDNLTTLNVLL